MKKSKKTGLGRGISALIPEIETTGEYSDNFFMCPVADIVPNRFQPRSHFSEKELKKLKDSIAEQGVIQPLLVRSLDDSYELIAGERRLRVAREIALTHVPVVVKTLTDEQMLEVSIIENIQRQDLNPLEEAEAYQRLVSEFNYTQEMVSKKIGKNRSTIANFLRLRGLPEEIKQSLTENEISMGHARAILGAGTAEEQLKVWKTVRSKALSVRQTENLVNSLKKGNRASGKKSSAPETVYLEDMSRKLSSKINSTVKIRKKGEKGKVEIAFKNQAELDRIVDILNNT